MVPYDGVVTDIAFWYRPFSTSMEGEFWLYKARFTSGGGAGTVSSVGKIGDLATGGNSANTYDISTILTSGNTVQKGDILIVLYKAIVSATSTYVRSSIVIEEA